MIEVTLKMIDEMMSDEQELISIYYGSDIQEADAESLRAQLASKYPGCDIELPLSDKIYSLTDTTVAAFVPAHALSSLRSRYGRRT
mgnify:CR=1 FL=1